MNSPTTTQMPEQPSPNAMEATGPGLSEPARLINIFVAPSNTFTDIRRNASWWVPFLILTIISTAYLFTVDKKIGFETIVDARMAHATPFMQRALERMPPEQKDRVYQSQVNGFRRSLYTAWVNLLIYGLLAGVLLMATFNFVFDAGIKFKRALAIVFYGALPRIVLPLLGILVVFLGTSPEGFDMENPVASNLGALVGINSDSPFLYRVLTGFDIVLIWVVVLIGLGFVRNTDKKISKGAAIGVVAGWYAVAVLVRAALSPIIG